MSKFKNIKGYEFKNNKVLRPTDKRDGGSVIYICKCSHCGNSEWMLSSRTILHSPPYSCGCVNNKSIGNTTHGMSKNEEGKKERFYAIWSKIKSRCYSNDKSYKKYKENGILVCERWKNSFENFKEDMYKGYKEACVEYGEVNVSIDRIDVDGNYSPENCRWANESMQKYNRNFIKDSKSKAIICTRIKDNAKVITVNAKSFSRMIFDTPNHHITEVCKGRRPKEKGWKFEYITKEEYMDFKRDGMDYIETPERFKLSIKYYNVDIRIATPKNTSREDYLDSMRGYYINTINIIEYGVGSEVYGSLGYKNVDCFKNSLRRKTTVRKLTDEEVIIYENNRCNHGIKF